ncbi:O-antigen ligase [Lachnospiraceae bacterium G41]|nr:O-antigen ligase [Lachnospiraceae bacterium G41]
MDSIFKIKIGSEYMLKYAIVATMAYASYATLLYSFFGQTTVLRTLLILFIVIVDLVAIIKNQKKVKPFLLLLLFFSVVFISNYIMYPGNRWVIKSLIIDEIKYVMLAFFLCIAQKSTIYSSLKIGSIIVLISNIFEPFTHYITGGEDGYMVYGMRLLLPTVLLGYYYLQERKKMYFFLMIISMILILLYGNRSALIISVFCFLLQLLLFIESKRRLIRIAEIILILGAGLLLFYVDALNVLVIFLESIGVSSRTMSLFNSGFDMAINNNGRLTIWGNCIQAISQKPWFGYGIGGERNLSLLGSNYVSRMGGVYAHNFVFEILLDFGIIFGSIILGIIILKSLKICIRKKHNEMTIMFTVLIISTALKLTFSSSIWSDLDVFICLGLGLGCYRNRMFFETNYRETVNVY